MPKGVYARTLNPNKGKYAVGTRHTTPQGEVVVLEKLDSKYIVVRFVATDYVTKCSRQNLVSGKVKDHRLPRVCGVGYLDGIKVQPRGTEQRRVYDLWANMLRRAYTDYQDCSVAKEWHSFRTFLNSVCDIPGWQRFQQSDSVHLDKDLRIPGNREYSLRACQFADASENMSEGSRRRWASH